MKKILVLNVFALFICAFLHPAISHAKPQVLLISSYHPGFPTFFKQINGLRSVLDPAGVHLDVEFMDSKRFMNKKNLIAFRRLLKMKLASLDKYDVVVTSDDNALNFVVKNKKDLFPATPIVFCGVNNQSLARSMNINENITGVIEAVSISDNIQAVSDLVPGLKTIYLIVDSTPSGQADLEQVNSLNDDFPEIKFVEIPLKRMNWAEMEEILGRLPNETAVLLLSAYRDKDGVSLSFEEGLQKIISSSSRPVFHLYEHGIGAGIIGGKVISHHEQGVVAGRIALDILNGTPVKDIPVVEGIDANKFIFDRIVLDRFKIRDSGLPAGSFIVNESESVWGAHRIEILTGLFIIAVLLVFSIALSMAYLKLRRTQEMVRESRERFALAMAANKDGIWDWNIETDDVYYSPGYKAMLGYSENELPSHVDSWVDLIHEDDRSRAFEVNNRCINNEIENFEVEFRMQARDGNWLWILGRGNAVERDETGKAVRMIGTHTDITELKSSLEEIRYLRNQLKSIIDSMPFILIGLNSKGQVTRWNRKASEVAGISDEQAVGKQVADVFPRLSPYMEHVRESLRDREIWTDPRVARRENGNIFYDDIMIYPICSGEQDGVVVQIENVTERVRLEDMLVQNEKMLSVGGLAAGMAHEINNPLGIIAQGAQNITRRVLGDLPANQKAAEARNLDLNELHGYMNDRDIPKIIEGISGAVDRAGKIVRNMLSFSRKNQDSFREHNVSKLLDRTIELAGNEYDLSTKYDFKKIEIVREYDSDISSVFCEGSEIQQVFLNLLKNSAQSMNAKRYRAGGPKFILRVFEQEGYVNIEIEDNGQGIDKSEGKRIFEPFYTTKKVGEGTGLGLAISYFIIADLHRGKLDVSSSHGNWTKFVVSLPVKQSVSS
ncbi:ABC transporter substrate binding protein [Desulfovibrio sp. JC022]|uniref:ABC transporter substrate binding protein n=1 Tax=Desulfovibrio sp. JC022 TaxID=2593642 RepID=UPI0013CF696B|nr:ABC transporter substrate binding protein [Desulfovibrio sp. JC022]NDV24457.1 PAS domain S-box protein [Desulfovibrio sp. JC022]